MKLSSIVKSYFSDLYFKIFYNKESIISYMIGYFIFAYLGFEMKTSRIILCNSLMVASFITTQLSIKIKRDYKK